MPDRNFAPASATARSEKGFTLLEVMLAVTITTVVLLTIYGVFTSVSRAKDRMESEGEGYHQARVLFDRIGREIRGTFYNNRDPRTRFEGGVDADGDPFLILSTTAVSPQSGPGAGIVVVRYRLEGDPGRDEGKKVLLRSEYPLFDTDGEDRPTYRLATGITGMRVRFYRNDVWYEEWDAEEERLPQMMEVLLELAAGEQSVPFRSTFEVPAIGVQ
ncbi:MAG: hypothetical protein C0617_04430 [Desulfuromonas sp.]|uniref:type II secretion system protein GspJ n=1 Tax=Desulfuromonas sp. TaxID=892 RepID=UPI000CBFE95B|nr:type II secretion system protein GspJ [Desulfuromonas sp.]PLX85324.1 MAG: hypothetical protein C0617_04430 [Desulfuromonas sp.]